MKKMRLILTTFEQRTGQAGSYFSHQHLSLAVFLGLLIFSWSSVLNDDMSHGGRGLDQSAFDSMVKFLGKLLGLNSETPPAYLDISLWVSTANLAAETLVMSVLAIWLASVSVIFTVLFTARNIIFGDSALFTSFVFKFIFYMFRFLYLITRAVPELVWAMILVFFLTPGIVPGVVALAIHNFGVLGKLTAELIENMDQRPIRSLRINGAGPIQVIFYGVLPNIIPQFLTYMLYRWEVIIRTTVVVGFISAGGLGREFRLFMSWLQYDRVLLILIWYLILVLFVDLVSEAMRKIVRS